MPDGSNSLIFSRVELHGRTAEKTCCSRMRRAISWVYWPPKSRTTMPLRSELGLGCCGCIVGVLDIVAPCSNYFPGNANLPIGGFCRRLLSLILETVAGPARAGSLSFKVD